MKDYTPRPKASQEVAKAHRARHQEETTETPTPARFSLPLGIAMCAVVLGMLAMFAYRPTQPVVYPPTPAPTVAPAAPTIAPVPTAAPAMIDAYASPDGALLGQIEADRQIAVAAHYGAGWIAYQDGAGLVWIRAVDRPDLALAGPDLAPAATQPQTGQGPTVIGEWTPPAETQPPAPPEPTQTWPTSAPVSPADFAKPDIRDRCTFVGCLGQQAVDLSRAQTCHALYWQYGDADPETIDEPDFSAVRGCIWEGLYR